MSTAVETKTPTVKVLADFTRYVLIGGTSKEHRAKEALPWQVTGYESVTCGRFMRIDGRWMQFGEDLPGHAPTHGTIAGVMFHNPVRK